MDNAEAVLRPKCEAGNGDACLNLGFHLLGLATINRYAAYQAQAVRFRDSPVRPPPLIICSASRVPIDFKKRFLQFKVRIDSSRGALCSRATLEKPR